MQEIEKLVGIKLEDFKLFVPNLKAGFSHAAKIYQNETSDKLKMVDSLVFLSLALFVV